MPAVVRPSASIMQLQMTSQEHIEILRQGETAWNRHRRESAGEDAPDFSGSHFPYADFSGFDLHNVLLQKAYLRGASLRKACLRQADLQSAYLIDADLEEADLSQARLVAVNLNGANLADCTFQSANLREADCGGANLSRADFTDADLHGVNLLGANLEGARFVRTRGLSSRQLMAGRNWQKALFHRDLADRLDLPLGHEAAHTVPGEAAAGGRQRSEHGDPSGAQQPIENNDPLDPSSQRIVTLSCWLDPTLG
jgi:uncharacterized protein YjbI with pentapeptide repeats